MVEMEFCVRLINAYPIILNYLLHFIHIQEETDCRRKMTVIYIGDRPANHK